MTTQAPWLVVGLGNPEAQYAGTRHNIGKELVAALEDDLPNNMKAAGLDVYMNNSGGAVRKLVSSKKAAGRLVVVHDELDLPLGKIKISFGASAGGHNGVKSVQTALKTQDFARVRVGISGATASGKLKRPAPGDIVRFVLGKFKPAEKDKLKKVKKMVAEALELIAKEGVEGAQSVINAR